MRDDRRKNSALGEIDGFSIAELLEHEARTLIAIRELVSASISVLVRIRQSGRMPELCAPAVDSVIEQSQLALLSTSNAASELFRVVGDANTIAEIVKSHSGHGGFPNE